MTYTRIALAAGATLILLAAGAYWFFPSLFSAGAGDTPLAPQEEINFSESGTVVKDKPGLKQGGWYFEYGSGTPKVVPILFSSISTCSWQEKSGRCKPSVFVNGRKARIDGVQLDAGVGVVRLTFTEPPPAR